MDTNKDIHYYLYRDEELIKSIYSQLVDDISDMGIIEYFGGDTQNYTRDYRLEACEDNNEKEKCKEGLKTELKLCKSNAKAVIREYANIQEIKDMKRMVFYNDIINDIEKHCKVGKSKELIHIKGNMEMYTGYNNISETFFKMQNSCIWLKKDLIKEDIVATSRLMGELNMVGYLLKECGDAMPNIIRAIAIYI